MSSGQTRRAAGDIHNDMFQEFLSTDPVIADRALNNPSPVRTRPAPYVACGAAVGAGKMIAQATVGRL